MQSTDKSQKVIVNIVHMKGHILKRLAYPECLACLLSQSCHCRCNVIHVQLLVRS